MQHKRKVSFASDAPDQVVVEDIEDHPHGNLPTISKQVTTAPIPDHHQHQVSRSPPKTSLPPKLLSTPEYHHSPSPTCHQVSRNNSNLLELSQMFEHMQSLNNKG